MSGMIENEHENIVTLLIGMFYGSSFLLEQNINI